MSTLPLGNIRSSATLVTVPSGSTRRRTAGPIGAPAIKSKPKLPTYALPCPSTTMSLGWPETWGARSACTTSEPSDSRRRSVASRMDTTRSLPSGSQPSPDGCCGTSASVRRSDPSSAADSTSWV